MLPSSGSTFLTQRNWALTHSFIKLISRLRTYALRGLGYNRRGQKRLARSWTRLLLYTNSESSPFYTILYIPRLTITYLLCFLGLFDRFIHLLNSFTTLKHLNEMFRKKPWNLSSLICQQTTKRQKYIKPNGHIAILFIDILFPLI